MAISDSAIGLFGDRTFRRWDVSAIGRFGDRTFRRWEIDDSVPHNFVLYGSRYFIWRSLEDEGVLISDGYGRTVMKIPPVIFVFF